MNWTPLIPVLADILTKNKSKPARDEQRQELQRAADEVDQRQDEDIETLEGAVRDLRRAIVALTNQVKALQAELEEPEEGEEGEE